MFYVRVEDEPEEIWDTLSAYGLPADLLSVNRPSKAACREMSLTFNACAYCYAEEVERRFGLRGKKARSSDSSDAFLSSLSLLAQSLVPQHD
jgi:hypothetical protein